VGHYTQLSVMNGKILILRAYPMHEPWLDVGRPDDLKQALATIENN